MEHAWQGKSTCLLHPHKHGQDSEISKWYDSKEIVFWRGPPNDWFQQRVLCGSQSHGAGSQGFLCQDKPKVFFLFSVRVLSCVGGCFCCCACQSLPFFWLLVVCHAFLQDFFTYCWCLFLPALFCQLYLALLCCSIFFNLLFWTYYKFIFAAIFIFHFSFKLQELV